jgi:hypothetical protein
MIKILEKFSSYLTFYSREFKTDFITNLNVLRNEFNENNLFILIENFLNEIENIDETNIRNIIYLQDEYGYNLIHYLSAISKPF